MICLPNCIVALSPKLLGLLTKLSELGATSVEITELLEQVGEDAEEEEVYEALKRINPELAEEFRKEMNLIIWRSDLRREPFRRDRIVKSLVRETGISKSLAEKIAREVEERLRTSELTFITSSLVRELALIKLIEYGLEDAYKKYLRLGVPVYDLLVMVKKGKNDLTRRLAGRLLLQYSILFLLPRTLTEGIFDGFLEIGGLYNPFVPFAATYYTRVSDVDRWFEGLAKYLFEPAYVDAPSIYVPSFLEEEHVEILKRLSKPLGAILWSSEEIEGVIRSDEPVYSFGKAPERRILDYIVVDVEKLSIMTPKYLERLEEVARALETYQERKREFVKAGNLYVKLEGIENVPEREKIRGLFSPFRIL